MLGWFPAWLVLPWAKKSSFVSANWPGEKIFSLTWFYSWKCIRIYLFVSKKQTNKQTQTQTKDERNYRRKDKNKRNKKRKEFKENIAVVNVLAVNIIFGKSKKICQ